jgi:HAMP domain-containing protein
MSKGRANWLQIKVVLGLGGLLTGAAVVFGYLSLLAEENHASQDLLSQVRQLQVQGQAIQRRGITYAGNAPRDFGPYERDMVIFYPDFVRDLAAFEQTLKNVTKTVGALPNGRFSAPSAGLIETVEKMQTGWTAFQRGFQDKLGPNPAEPRLEWGAEYVKDNQALINSLTGELIATVDQTVQERLRKNAELTTIAVIGASVFLLTVVIWFYFSIVRRISLTVAGCQRVAQGDFGYQLPVKGNDELTTLAQAFNSLSARTRFVLTMLSKMHRPGSAESKIGSLWIEASGYLQIKWMGLWEVDASGSSMRLLSLRADKPIADGLLKTLENHAHTDTSLINMSREMQPFKSDKLTEYVLKTPNARFLRELVKTERLNSVLMVPLTSDDGWKGLLMFVTDQPAAYTDEQVELMGNLSSYMANGFAHAGNEAATPDPVLAHLAAA